MLGKTEEATRRRKTGRRISINNCLEIDKTIMCKCHNKNGVKECFNDTYLSGVVNSILFSLILV